MAAKYRRQLDALSYRCTPQLIGDATVYLREFPDGVRSLWALLERNYRDRMEREEIQAPYSIVMNALRCLTGGYAFFDPDRGFLVTRHPIDDDTLCDAFNLMSGLAKGEHIDAIDLRNPDRLATRIAETPEQPRLLAEYLQRTDAGQPNAPKWVYESVTWDLACRLSQQVWHVDSQDITLRPDSRGGVVAWDQPWSDKTGTAHSLARIRLIMKTVPNITDPVILLASSATRIKTGMSFARTVLVEQADPARPLIEVEMAGRGRVRTINRMALQTLARLAMDHSVLHGIQDRADAEAQAERKALEEGSTRWYPPGGELGKVRPIHSKNYKFPVGTGVGMHFQRELARQFREVFGDAAVSPQIVVDLIGMRQENTKDGLYSAPEDVARSLRSSGHSHLRLVCLWYKDENRLRMIKGLCDAYGLDPSAVDPIEGVPLPLYEDVVSAVFHEADDFLTHGPKSGLEADLKSFPSLKPTPGMLVGVWAETYYDAKDEQDQPSEEHEHASVDSQGQSWLSPDEDAKPRARRTLARLEVVSQFMKDRKVSTRPGKKDEDHPVILAQRDLNRSLGIIDRRIDAVMVDAIGPYPANGVAHCGIHVRRQSKQRGDNAAKICITASVLKPPAHDGDAWTLHGWSYTHRQWQPYPLAQAAYHAQDYPPGKMTELLDDNQGYKKVARTIDQALTDLVRYLDGLPYTVTVDGAATRRLWDGLHNNKQGETGKPGSTWIPGHTLPLRDRPLAVIRLNKDPDEVLRPVGATWLDAEEETTKKDTATSLFRVETDLGHPAWLLVTIPPQHDGASAGRLGNKKTRWTADHGSSTEGDLRKNEVAANWYSMTATEIYVIPLQEDVSPNALARMTARLCHQPLVWTNRTRYCVHLHAAQQMDLDHPQYRRSAVADEPDATGLGEPQVDDAAVRL